MCRQTLTGRVATRYSSSKRQLIQLLYQTDQVCTTADVWKSRGRSYMGVTSHWLDSLTLGRRSANLAIQRVMGRHTYDVIAKHLESIHQEFGLEDKVRVTITDSRTTYFLHCSL